MGNNNKLFVFHYKLVRICFLFRYWKWALWQKSNRCLKFLFQQFLLRVSIHVERFGTSRDQENPRKTKYLIELALFSSVGEWSNSFDRDIIFENWLRQRSLLQRRLLWNMDLATWMIFKTAVVDLREQWFSKDSVVGRPLMGAHVLWRCPRMESQHTPFLWSANVISIRMKRNRNSFIEFYRRHPSFLVNRVV